MSPRVCEQVLSQLLPAAACPSGWYCSGSCSLRLLYHCAAQTLGTGGCQKYVVMPKTGSQCPEMVLQAASASEPGFAANFFSSFRLVDRLGRPPGKPARVPGWLASTRPALVQNPSRAGLRWHHLA